MLAQKAAHPSPWCYRRGNVVGSPGEIYPRGEELPHGSLREVRRGWYLLGCKTKQGEGKGLTHLLQTHVRDFHAHSPPRLPPPRLPPRLPPPPLPPLPPPLPPPRLPHHRPPRLPHRLCRGYASASS